MWITGLSRQRAKNLGFKRCVTLRGAPIVSPKLMSISFATYKDHCLNLMTPEFAQVTAGLRDNLKRITYLSFKRT